MTTPITAEQAREELAELRKRYERLGAAARNCAVLALDSRRHDASCDCSRCEVCKGVLAEFTEPAPSRPGMTSAEREPLTYAMPPRDAIGEEIRKRAAKIYALLMQNRERYVRAWCAATGIHPTEARMVERDNSDGSKTVTIEPRGTVPVPLSELELLRAKAAVYDASDCEHCGHYEPMCSGCVRRAQALRVVHALEQKASGDANPD